MKAISIRQPFADLICSGVKDIENRSWKPKEMNKRLLIHAGSSRHKLKNEDLMPLCWYLPIENAQAMGNLFDLGSAPTSAVVGVATLVDCEEQSDSPWSEEGPGNEYKWVFNDARFFVEPIEGIKGKLNIFDIPEIDENNLPPLADHFDMVRDGAHLTIPLCKASFNAVANGEADTIFFNLTPEVAPYLVNEAGEGLETSKITLYFGNEEIECDVDLYEAFDVLDEENNQPITYDYPNGKEYVWRKIEIGISNIRKK